MSGKKQDHSNEFYLMQFLELYPTDSVNRILNTLELLVRNDELFGFGIYFKSNRNEFSIVLKLKDVKGRNWIHIAYLLQSRGWVNIIKQANLGPKELYEAMNSRGQYTFKTIQPTQFSTGQAISELNAYFSDYRDVEYNLSKFEKYGGNNGLIRQNSKKSRKQYSVMRKTSRKNSRKNSRKMI